LNAVPPCMSKGNSKNPPPNDSRATLHSLSAVRAVFSRNFPANNPLTFP
jgi:hypothetical protein